MEKNTTNAPRTIYCSAGSTSSVENGTQESPYKTVENAVAHAYDGDTVLIERGYTYDFFGSIYGRGVNIGAYGVGNAPVISRFVKIRNVDGDLFTRDVPYQQLWTINFNKLVSLSGRTADELGNIGFIYNPYIDKIVYGVRTAFITPDQMYTAFGFTGPTIGQLQAYTSLDTNGRFYQSADGRTIKVYSTVNPNTSVYAKNFNKPSFGDDPREVQELWFSIDGRFMVNPHDCTIADLTLVGFGSDAIFCGKDNVRIHNVTIDLIGGVASNVGTVNFRRQGIGIELWHDQSSTTPLSNIEISNCRISRVFDGAVSLNANVDRSLDYAAENISIRNCTFLNCRNSLYAGAYYVNGDGSLTGGVSVRDFRFERNRSISPGCKDFEETDILDAHLFSGSPGLDIANNLFYDGNLMGRYTDVFGFDMRAGNVCFIQPGQKFLIEAWDLDQSVVYPEDEEDGTFGSAVHAYRQKAHDNHAMFVGLVEPVSNPN